MAHYDDTDQNSIAKFILTNLPRHKQLALATADDSGQPWVVCVNLAFDNQVNFMWRSRTDTEHSKYLRARPSVSICVFSETSHVGDFGYYCKAIAREVNDEAELSRLLAIRYKGRPVPPPADFLGDSPDRLYYAKVTAAWVNDDRHAKNPVDLAVLQQLAAHDN